MIIRSVQSRRSIGGRLPWLKPRLQGLMHRVSCVVGIASALALLSVPASQSQTVADALPKTRPGSALLQVADVIFTPVWCSPTVVAFQRERPTDGKRWIEYHDIGRNVSNLENLQEEGGLVACSADGRRLMRRLATGYVLVSTGGYWETRVFGDADLISADDQLSLFVFKTDAGADRQPPSTLS